MLWTRHQFWIRLNDTLETINGESTARVSLVRIHKSSGLPHRENATHNIVEPCCDFSFVRLDSKYHACPGAYGTRGTINSYSTVCANHVRLHWGSEPPTQCSSRRSSRLDQNNRILRGWRDGRAPRVSTIRSIRPQFIVLGAYSSTPRGNPPVSEHLQPNTVAQVDLIRTLAVLREKRDGSGSSHQHNFAVARQLIWELCNRSITLCWTLPVSQCACWVCLEFEERPNVFEALCFLNNCWHFSKIKRF